MCGFLGNVIDSPDVQALLSILGLDELLPYMRYNTGSGPASHIDIIAAKDGSVGVYDAIWWLLLSRDDDGILKPSKYTSFNTRSDKLNVKTGAGYQAFRQSRCIIPATYIIEGEGPKSNRRYHKIEPKGTAFALGGLYREWVNKDTGEITLSCSVITLPPHPKWKSIHSKSTPLFLPVENSETIDKWLDSDFDSIDSFHKLMKPSFPTDLVCTPIDRPGSQKQIGNEILIRKK